MVSESSRPHQSFLSFRRYCAQIGAKYTFPFESCFVQVVNYRSLPHSFTPDLRIRLRTLASIRKLKTGYRAEVARKGVRKSQVFPTKQAAKDWAAHEEYKILSGDKIAAKMALGEVFDRYANEVSPQKKGARWEIVRLKKFQRDQISKTALEDLTPDLFGKWRDSRIREVGPASVIREMQLMSSVLNTARKEWGLLRVNPLSDVRRPPKPPPRERLPTQDEIDRIRHSAGEDLTKTTARAFHAFLFALETAMRAGEIAGLEWDRVDLEKRVARLVHTKNGRPRNVPLSTEAVRLLKMLPRLDPVFGLKSEQLDALFRKSRDKAGVVGLTFHDSRHAAITALSKKLRVLALAKMVGHTDIRMLMVYYDESAEDIARDLD